jgi:hypothetical protein
LFTCDTASVHQDLAPEEETSGVVWWQVARINEKLVFNLLPVYDLLKRRAKKASATEHGPCVIR